MGAKIYFDMDGTVAGLYRLPDWLECLRNEVSGTFLRCEPLFEQKDFYPIVEKLLLNGVKFGVITWLPMQATDEYQAICTEEKRKWCEDWMPFIETFAAQPYGIDKSLAITKHFKTEYLIDDNKEVCQRWKTEKQRKALCCDTSAFGDVVACLWQIADELGIE